MKNKLKMCHNNDNNNSNNNVSLNVKLKKNGQGELIKIMPGSHSVQMLVVNNMQ